MRTSSQTTTAIILASTLALGAVQARKAHADCKDLPDHDELQQALVAALGAPSNAGLGNEMWGTIVDRDGIVCAVAFTGDALGDQWPGSRAISAQKANTANAFSLPPDANDDGFNGALSSGNLYGQTLPGGSLFELPESNPVDPRTAYKGNPKKFGQANDPMVGKPIGGVNVFGGGLALYDGAELLGGLGVSGDTSCTDHVIAWRTRFELDLDDVPGGVGDGGTDDNLIINDSPTPNTFEHPDCGDGVAGIIAGLPVDFPIGGDDD